MSEGNMSEHIFLLENWTNLPEGSVVKRESNNLPVDILRNTIFRKFGQSEYMNMIHVIIMH